MMPYCRSCGEQLVGEAKFCPECGRDQRAVAPASDESGEAAAGSVPAGTSVSQQRTRPGGKKHLGMRPGFAISLGVAIVGLALFLLFFHVVPSALTVFPKESPSFANTFIDVEAYIRRYNDGDLMTKMSMRESYVFQKLQEKELIYQKD